MQWVKTLLLALLGLVGLAVLTLFLLANWSSEPPVDPAWAVNGTGSIPDGAVTVRFTGTTTLLFSDGETRWMVDGWFSRFGLPRTLLGKIAPDPEAISSGLAANGVSQLAAVIPVHSHFDHAMDSPEVALRTGAVLMGSESTAMIGRGWGLPEEQMQVLSNRVPVSVGQFTITPIESKHYEFSNPWLRERAIEDATIAEPLVPPVKSLAYKMGKNYVLHVRHPKGSFAVVGSAGFEPGGLAGYEADVLFLGIGGIGGQTADYRETLWRETVDRLRPERVALVHYDSLTAPIDGPFQGAGGLLNLLSGGGEGNARLFLEEKAAANPTLRLITLPRYDEVVLFP